MFYTETEYDKNGNKVKETKFLIDGSVMNIVEYKYNQENRPIEKVERNEMYGTQTCTNWEYDAAGNMIRENYQDPERDFTHRYECSYDDKGNILTSTLYQGGSDFKVTRYEYDAAGNMIKKSNYFCSESGIEMPNGYIA